MSERSAAETSEQVAAEMISARQTLAAAVAFGATLPARDATPGVSAVLDAVLVALAFWALAPGILRGGPRFMRPGHWSRILPVPLLLAAIAFVRDLWLLVRHGA